MLMLVLGLTPWASKQQKTDKSHRTDKIFSIYVYTI